MRIKSCQTLASCFAAASSGGWIKYQQLKKGKINPMNKKMMALVIALGCIVLASPAAAHTLWVNLYQSQAHMSGHAIASIGWGHSIPMDDIARDLNLKSYSLVDPDLMITELPMPSSDKPPQIKSPSGLTVQSGDIGVRKMVFSKESKPGVYQVALVTKDNFYSVYLDQKGRKRWIMKTMDQVKDAKKVLAGMNYKAYAKAYFKVKQWSEPKPLGHDLEIIPLTDLSKVRTGDKVDFKVTFMGKSLNTNPAQGIEYITAMSNTFGGPDKFTLSSVVFGGKGSFRMPSAGQWVVNVYTRQTVSPDNRLKHLVGKCTMVMYSSSISFNVKP